VLSLVLVGWTQSTRVSTLRRYVAYTRRETVVNRLPESAEAIYAPHNPTLLYPVADLQDLQLSF
jgi:hypothetical protein